MDTKEKHVRENERREEREEREMSVNSTLPEEGRERKRENTRKINNMWLWLGVLVLVAILLWWIFSIGLFGDMTAAFNG